MLTYVLVVWYNINMKYEILKKLGSGSAGDAYLLADQKVIIIGKREDSFSTYQSLYETSKILEGKITAIKYPQIHELVFPCEEYPFGALIEECILGIELRQKVADLNGYQKRELGKNLALFLNQLHKIETTGDKNEEIKINLSKYDRSIGLLKDFLSEEIIEKLVSIKDDYYQLIRSKDFCITHGDLNAGNIIVDEDNKLAGVIDFGNMEYYIPEVEFVHMYFFDREIYDSMVQFYDKEINEKEMVLLELVINIRHFKNIMKFGEKRINCLNNIEKLLNEYLNFAKQYFLCE